MPYFIYSRKTNRVCLLRKSQACYLRKGRLSCLVSTVAQRRKAFDYPNQGKSDLPTIFKVGRNCEVRLLARMLKINAKLRNTWTAAEDVDDDRPVLPLTLEKSKRKIRLPMGSDRQPPLTPHGWPFANLFVKLLKKPNWKLNGMQKRFVDHHTVPHRHPIQIIQQDYRRTVRKT